MSNDVFEFCRDRLKPPTYKAKGFHKLLHLLDAVAAKEGETIPPHDTTPGAFSETVSVKNAGETAFQRALYALGSGRIAVAGQQELLSWHDIELPITFSGKGRRRCVDLIGSMEHLGCFLCELKHAKAQQSPPGNAADYAIFEALIYFGIITQNHEALDEGEVWRDGRRLAFRWEDVAASKTILVLANDRYWKKARTEANARRIRDLVGDIADKLKIKVLLWATLDCAFFDESNVQDGKYAPRIPSPGLWKPALD